MLRIWVDESSKRRPIIKCRDVTTDHFSDKSVVGSYGFGPPLGALVGNEGFNRFALDSNFKQISNGLILRLAGKHQNPYNLGSCRGVSKKECLQKGFWRENIMVKQVRLGIH